MTAPSRLADLLASVSLVADLGFALPPETSLRSTVIATALARRIGMPEAEVADVYYTALLEHIGCTGFAHETAIAYGDEMVVNAAIALTDPDHSRDALDTFVRPVVRGRGPLGGARLVAYTLLRGDAFGRRFATAVCEVGRETARRIGLPDGVRRALYDVVESWNGKSGARGLKGEEISPVARIAALATTIAQFDEIGGAEAVEAGLRQRSGGSLDPGLVDAFLAGAGEILDESRSGDPYAEVLAAEPSPVRTVSESHIPEVAAAVGDVADLKSPYTLGHSAGVAALVAGAAARMGLDDAATARLSVAALLHDVGRVGISNAIWERRGPLTVGDWEQVRLHPYHSERILARSEALRPHAVIGGLHHERLDGSGYHRAVGGREIGPEARLLAAADALHAMTEDRPHRPAIPIEGAASSLREEVAAGRLAGEAVDAVTAAAGVATPRSGRSRPADLSEREVEVLGLVARGLSNREIADRLVVSPRTAEHHVQHIYTKIGVSSRAAAALFAMEHGLLA